MDVEVFIDKFVKIEYVEGYKGYGHHPFQFYGEKGDEIIILSLLRVDSKPFYTIIKDHISSGVAKLFCSIDFPKMGDMPHDFVLIITYDKTEISLKAILYDSKGKIVEKLDTNNNLMNTIQQQIESIIFDL